MELPLDDTKPTSTLAAPAQPPSPSPSPPTDYHHLFTTESPAALRAREARLLRRVDARLLPFLVVMYLLNFLDRSNLAQARQGALERDLGMRGTDFNLATGVFFVGYLLMQLPSNLLLTRVRPSRYLGAVMTLWGVVSACNAATTSFGSLVAVRFILGFVEVRIYLCCHAPMDEWTLLCIVQSYLPPFDLWDGSPA